ncbi:tetratricopeptide repeat protein [Catellatospora bangladeshensis]|uniref:Sel1 repeat family protein n=1 Tax=Catellatospora bangladeshensis TaxID=310355 RepID=A0A8J3JS98_9ACTN|nr:sel1 repeat family protein [Catellatospora bangladeshensis]GIF84210.1 hypothetical protein Cba03nite_55590 [Catellatospora bangladeshensis]
MDTVMLLTLVMILGGPVFWWVLRRTATFNSAPGANASSLVMLVSLLLFIVAGLIMFFTGVDSTAGTVGRALWLFAGLLAIWATGKWSFALPAIVDRWSARHEAMLRAQAEAGNPQAAYALGLGFKMRRDHDGARRWLQQAAEAGLTSAQWDLGRLVEETDGLAAAKPWFMAAAANGHPGAQRLLAAGGPYDVANG